MCKRAQIIPITLFTYIPFETKTIIHQITTKAYAHTYNYYNNTLHHKITHKTRKKTEIIDKVSTLVMLGLIIIMIYILQECHLLRLKRQLLNSLAHQSKLPPIPHTCLNILQGHLSLGLKKQLLTGTSHQTKEPPILLLKYFQVFTTECF